MSRTSSLAKAMRKCHIGRRLLCLLLVARFHLVNTQKLLYTTCQTCLVISYSMTRLLCDVS